MWEENKNVALGVAKENNGSTSNISNSFPPSLGQEEAKGTFWALGCSWCFCRPGLKAFHGVQRTLPVAEDFIVHSGTFISDYIQKASAQPCNSGCSVLHLDTLQDGSQTPLASGTDNGAAFTPLTENPQTLRGKLFWKEPCCGSG